MIQSQWGPFCLDLKASSITTKLQAYASWMTDNNEKTVDAFSIQWNFRRMYAFQVIPLIPSGLKNMKDYAEVVLEVPWWPRIPWFLEIMQLSGDSGFWT
ncbi:hypothetical protein XELAEV_18042316mg, partial [Xenopus laevis]